MERLRRPPEVAHIAYLSNIEHAGLPKAGYAQGYGPRSANVDH